MKKFVPVTKLLGTFAFSFWALVLHTTVPLIVLVMIELILLALCGSLSRNSKAVFSLCIFAAFLALVQLLGGGSLESAYVTGLRMLAMTVVFIILLTTTRLQDLTAALVKQIKIPYEYAFMFTAALRFVPDFLAESQTVQEAQACRGLSTKGNVFKKLKNYMSVIQPLMLKSLGRSETMALSLELRGFGSNEHSFMSNVRPKGIDYVVMAVLAACSILVVYMRLNGIV
ncbi:MAG: energy-coupling factor transporter transmembrane protein EcfT [Megasphaera sp.]|nr:energy-coupling factor transporter transmembrane protein EcfT [Megasphaera sp.]MCH4188205.1 energy-coupling factor transporter transmembrane protein EcfT [Megasphaera sp.]MCH4218116.1 energy-coupling factor transporter transmembrane protein EcfT [Megasphaera sp.]